MKSLLLAAGFGTRFRPVTDTLPKPCIPFKGFPLGLWPLVHLKRAGATHLAINTHHLPAKIKETFSYLKSQFSELNFSDEQPHILGSGGGIKHAEKYLKGDGAFWVANGDEVFIPEDLNTFNHLAIEHAKSNALATLLVMKHSDVGIKFGGVWCEGDTVVDFGKTAPSPQLSGLHYTGFQLISDRIFEMIKKNEESNIFYDIYRSVIKNGELVKIYECRGLWFEMGNISDHAKAEHELSDNTSTQFLEILKELKNLGPKHGKS